MLYEEHSCETGVENKMCVFASQKVAFSYEGEGEDYESMMPTRLSSRVPTRVDVGEQRVEYIHLTAFFSRIARTVGANGAEETS